MRIECENLQTKPTAVNLSDLHDKDKGKELENTAEEKGNKKKANAEEKAEENDEEKEEKEKEEEKQTKIKEERENYNIDSSASSSNQHLRTELTRIQDGGYTAVDPTSPGLSTPYESFTV